jgi:hypothetical protein
MRALNAPAEAGTFHNAQRAGGICFRDGARLSCVAMTFRGRRAAAIENEALRVTVLEGGGHIAEILDKRTGVSPLWIPQWPTIEPGDYGPVRHAAYGGGADASLLASLMGHNLCLDVFGGPSPEEAAAGLPAHGEASVARFALEAGARHLDMDAVLPGAQLRVTRRIALEDRTVRIRERVENLSATDRPVGWTEHMTMGPPFLEKGLTQFRMTADRSMVFEGRFGPADYLAEGREFRWPHAPAAGGGTADLRVYSSLPASSAYTTHRMSPDRATASFTAYSPDLGLTFGYGWRRADFPWLGMWEENQGRRAAPWHGRELTLGMEFGVSPFPDSRRAMIERGPLWGTPTFRWIPARTRVEVNYVAVLAPAPAIPDSIEC